MGIRIYLRTNKTCSYFRRTLFSFLKEPKSDTILICSGYICENFYHYCILNDGDLLGAIKTSNKKTITIAGKMEKDWKTGKTNPWEYSYRDFCSRLRRAGVSGESYILKTKNWHAKVALILEKKEPIAGLIGSSNLTQPAFGEDVKLKKFNYEADVLIWKNVESLNHYFHEEIDPQDPLSPIEGTLNPAVRQPDEVTRLTKLYHIINDIEDLESVE